MGCCPENDSFDIYDYLAPIVLPASTLKAMEESLPFDDGVKRQFARPFFHDDGSIEYPRLGDEDGSPPEINGYERDAENDFLFHPLWKDCIFRLQGTHMIGKCGCVDVVMVCQHGQCPLYLKQLRHTHCQQCELRSESRSESA